eukprot:COSAG01_NODE_19289_length_1019_cov_1.042391_2_plen_67_part_01
MSYYRYMIVVYRSVYVELFWAADRPAVRVATLRGGGRVAVGDARGDAAAARAGYRSPGVPCGVFCRA